MNVEIYSYSVFTTVIGMAVVFLFLWFLSLLMSFLKILFKEKKKGMEQEAVLEDERVIVESEKRVDWIVAAVSAYLTAEEEELYPHSAKSWKPVSNERFDPWLIGGKLLKRWSGV
ncbi:MAG: OadG family protein [Spirochaetales bacterium]|nr:OadG family protein [Spirochaetales bacterium]